MKKTETQPRSDSWSLESASGSDSQDRLGKVRRMAAGSLLASLVLTGCGFGENSHSKPGPSADKQPVASEQLPIAGPLEEPADRPLDASPAAEEPDFDALMGEGLDKYGVCGPERYREFAEACLEFYESGKVALVNFGSLSDVDASKVANDLEEYVNRVTGGLVQTSFEAVPASEEAKSLLKERSPEGCTVAATGDYWSSAAWAAADRMFEDLEGVDKIIGLNPYPACDDMPIGGVAFYDHNNHYAEVIGEVEDSERALRVAAHEFFHFLGLGHSGVVEHGPYSQQLESFYEEGKTTVDLRAYLEGSDVQYYPYGVYAGVGESSIMGELDLDLEHRLSAYEMRVLQWPYSILEKQPDSKTAVAASRLEAGSMVEYNAVEYKDKKYAQIDLAEPFKLAKYGNGQSGSEEFDRLIFTPDLDRPTGRLAVNLRLLSQKGNNSAIIGRLIGSGEYSLDIDGGQAVIKISNQTVTIEYLS